MSTPVRAATETAVTRGLDQVVEIETPEQVVFSYTVAGIGSRAAAALIDHGIIVAVIIALVLLDALAIAPAFHTTSATARIAQKTGAWVVVVFGMLQFVLQWGYYLLFEALWDGQTPGKRWLKLRVVQDGGYSVSFSASSGRNLARFIDIQPFPTYLVGVIAVAVSKTSKRLGDQLGGTIVVRERIVPLTELAAPADAAAPRVGAETTAALTDAELELLQRFTARVDTLDPARKEEFARQLANRFKAHVRSDGDLVSALTALLERERVARAQGAGVRGQTGAAREQYRLLHEGAARWNRFAARLAEVQKSGLARLSPDEVAEFVAQYREVATDLARLSTAARGRDSSAVFQLSRLVAGGHNLLYRRKSLARREVANYVFGAVPAELRRSALPILAAALLLFGSGAIACVSVIRNPTLVEEMVPPGMIERAEQNAERAARGDKRYIDVEDYARPILASRIVRNNVQVAMAAFASGLTAGVFTVFLLVMNGVSIGSVLGLFATKGVLPIILGFVLAHSVFELTAICIAAGAGFVIAKGILLPGVLTRREAMVVQGKRALRLLTASALFLLLAGFIEGLISPRVDLSIAFKVVVAAVSALLVVVYWSGRFITPTPPTSPSAGRWSDALRRRTARTRRWRR